MLLVSVFSLYISGWFIKPASGVTNLATSQGFPSPPLVGMQTPFSGCPALNQLTLMPYLIFPLNALREIDDSTVRITFCIIKSPTPKPIPMTIRERVSVATLESTEE